MRENFLAGLPALEKLVNNVKRAAQRGYLKGLDGRKVWLRRDDNGKVKDHTALNTLLQSAGAIIFKATLALIHYRILTKRDSVNLLISYHDEVQLECYPDEAEEVRDAVVKCMQDAGTYFNLRCPIDGDGSIGRSWAETH